MDITIKLSITRYGDSKIPIALLICFLKQIVKILSYAYKPEGMTQFDIFHILVGSYSELSPMLFLNSTPSSQNMKYIEICPSLSS